MIELDHIAIGGETLAEATACVEDALGVPLQPGGEHAVFHTHNTLLGLEDGLYLEAIAANPNAPQPDRPRWFDLDRFSGAARLSNWICRTPNLTDTLADIPMELGAPVDLERGTLRWRMAVPSDGILPFDNTAPALIEWQTDQHPATRLAQQGVRLTRLTVRHPEAAALSATLAGQLKDDRIAFETGSAALAAEFDTPHGRRVIGP
ncbi:VOC family protein [Aliishimia ponticola]|uniref:VOC family protein n=1 Tax=Aliishimia ponticola TaxID=2499833 RepID=A0A4S4N987_9RHOB|nr:VOC family protein [Aliishimia ponticola]THH35796.1 VOC family protein [Aliishimia ponticola]